MICARESGMDKRNGVRAGNQPVRNGECRDATPDVEEKGPMPRRERRQFSSKTTLIR